MLHDADRRCAQSIALNKDNSPYCHLGICACRRTEAVYVPLQSSKAMTSATLQDARLGGGLAVKLDELRVVHAAGRFARKSSRLQDSNCTTTASALGLTPAPNTRHDAALWRKAPPPYSMRSLTG